MWPRILAFFVLLISVLFWPIWISIILAFAGMVYFNVFLEAIFSFLLSDVLYGVREAKFSGTVYLSFFAAIIFLTIIEIIKKKLRFYDSKNK